MIDLLTPSPIITVPITEKVMYGEATIETAARIVAEMMTPLAQVDHALIREVVQAVEPWTPVHPKEGRITKRIAATLHKKYGAAVADRVIAVVGQYLADDMPSDALHYDITDRFNWQAGEFGDHASCFWGGGKLTMMEASGIRALRFYTKKGDKYKGSARTWVAPAPAGVGHAVLFNAYGHHLEQFKQRMKVIAPDTNVEMVTLTNHGDRKGDLFINLGVGVLVGAPDVQHHREVDLRLYMNPDDLFRCPECDDLKPIETRRTINNRRICLDCAADYVACILTGRNARRDDCIEVDVRIGRGIERRWARADVADTARRCGDCGHLVYMGKLISASVAGKHIYLCGACIVEKELVVNCRTCGASKRSRAKCYCQL